MPFFKGKIDFLMDVSIDLKSLFCPSKKPSRLLSISNEMERNSLAREATIYIIYSVWTEETLWLIIDLSIKYLKK
jgi:hypothetical protein